MTDPFDIESGARGRGSERPVEWEESAVDSTSYVEGFSTEGRTQPRLSWQRVLIVLAIGAFLVKLGYLQLLRGGYYRYLAESNRVRSVTLLAPRGTVSDRYGQAIAQNTPGFDLVAVPADLPREGLPEVEDRLAQSFGLDRAELAAQLENVGRASYDPVTVKADLSAEDSIRFQAQADTFPGFRVREVPIRSYPEAEAFSHLLGYTGAISPGELDRLGTERYDRADYVGKAGVELVYEKFLHGQNGEHRVEVDATGKTQQVLGELPAKPGQTLVLNIDRELQLEIFRAFRARNPNGKGAVVAMDPKSGAVLALLSVPGYDTNQFAHGIKSAEYQQLLENKQLPLFNRVLSGTYPPGSTVKPMVLTAGLSEGAVTERTVINDRGALVIPNQFDPSVSYTFVGWKRSGLGAMDARSAIAESSDIYFYVLSGGHPTSPVKGLGIQKLASWYRRFGLGEKTGIDLPGEKPGVVPDPEWKKAYFKDNPILSEWYLGDTYHVGIGQGDLLVTPLQVCLWTATIANGGVGMRPEVLREVVEPSGKRAFSQQPEVLVQKVADDRTLKVVQEGMRQTVTAGSGKALSDLGIQAAGKTGTSQFDGSDPSRTHAWFTSYAPYENPEIALTVLVEAGGEGHSAAVPIARDVLDWWSKNRHGK